MGKLIRFGPRRRRKRSWTRAADYGARPAPQPAKFWPEKKSTWGDAFRATRPWIFLIFLVAIWIAWRQPELIGAPDFLATEPQRVEAQWTRCGYGRGHYCVVDGDSFKIGQESYRVLGVDAPEMEARCPAEAKRAEAATRALHDWLNAGPFFMQGRWDEPTDRYGRALRELYRSENGERRWVGDTLVGEGFARRYYGGTREGWCG